MASSSGSTSTTAASATGTSNTNTNSTPSMGGGGSGGASSNNPHAGGGAGGGTRKSGGGGVHQSSGKEYCLRWNNHQPNLVSFFTELLGNESFVDVTLVSSEGKKIMAHKLILSACSPYFQHVFENNPCKHPIVILKDVQYSDLRTIIKFIYNGEVNISQDRMNSILATAGTLKVKGLAEVPADEIKRVGGNKHSESSSSRHHVPPYQSSSSWGSEDRDLGSELPRKKLKKSSSATGIAGSSTNGEHSSGGSFESGVGASVSRSIDEGGLGAEGNVSSPSSRPAPPPLTAATQPKSRSLDTGLQEGPHGDSELSSGGFSENQNYDESSLGGERGYDLEVADLKIDPVSDDGELEFDEDDNAYGADDNAEYGDSSSNSYLNMSASSSASYFHQQSGLQFGPSGVRRRVRYPKFPGTPDNSVITNSKYETAITDLLTNPSLTFREAAQRHGLNASSVWYHYRMKHGYRRKVDPYE